MATVNQLKKIFENGEKFFSLDSHALATHSGFLSAEEEIGRNKVNRLFREVEYALQSASYAYLAHASELLADATAEFQTVSFLNRQYEIRYNEVYFETYGSYPSQAVGVGA